MVLKRENGVLNVGDPFCIRGVLDFVCGLVFSVSSNARCVVNHQCSLL